MPPLAKLLIRATGGLLGSTGRDVACTSTGQAGSATSNPSVGGMTPCFSESTAATKAAAAGRAALADRALHRHDGHAGRPEHGLESGGLHAVQLAGGVRRGEHDSHVPRGDVRFGKRLAACTG